MIMTRFRGCTCTVYCVDEAYVYISAVNGTKFSAGRTMTDHVGVRWG